MRRVLTILAALLLTGYLAMCALMFVQQRSLLYYPQATRTAPDTTGFALQRDGIVLRGWVVNPGHGQPVLYYGGNSERIEANLPDFAAWFPGRSVYLLAYRGFGASDGTPGERELLEDALALFDHVAERHPDEPVAVIGRSLGSGVAAHVAANRPVERLALITPFDSMAAVAQAHYPWLPVRWLLRDRYESDRALRNYAAPVLVVRAGNDSVVPARNTDRLIAALPGRPQVVEIPEGNHNNLIAAPEYAQALMAFFGPPVKIPAPE